MRVRELFSALLYTFVVGGNPAGVRAVPLPGRQVADNPFPPLRERLYVRALVADNLPRPCGIIRLVSTLLRVLSTALDTRPPRPFAGGRVQAARQSATGH